METKITVVCLVLLIIGTARCQDAIGQRCTGPVTGQGSSLNISELIPEWYDKYQVPTDNGKPVVVKTELSILGLRSVSPQNMMYEMDLFVSYIWREPRLCDVSEEKYHRTLRPEWQNHLWMPDVYFYNSVRGHVHKTLTTNEYLKLWPNKTFFLTARVNLALTCRLHLERYPMDNQTCHIVLKSLSHTIKDVILEWERNVHISSKIILPEFDIIGTDTCSNTSVYKIGNFTSLMASVHLKRRMGYYVIHIYVPSAIIVVMSMVSFWLPPDCPPARVGLPITSILSLVTQQTRTSISSVSYVRAMDVWMLACVAFVFGTLLEYAVISVMLKRKKQKQTDKPKQIPDEKTHRTFLPISGTEEMPEKPKNYFTPEVIDRVCCVAFPVLYFITIIVYCAYYV